MEGEVGLEAFARSAWSEAYSALGAADRASALTASELERYSTVCHLLGHDDEGAELGLRAHQSFLEAQDWASAARCAFWLGLAYMDRGEMAQGGGWFARGRRILDESGADCPEQGYLLIPTALQALEEGEVERAKEIFGDVRRTGGRFQDADLLAFACLGTGYSLIRSGARSEGAVQLDEAMVAVVSGSVAPLVAGTIYCAVIEACSEMFDWRRAQEWTEALTRWCEAQPDLVLFRGRCQVYRAEVMQRHGDWQRAMEAARDAERLLGRGHPAIGGAYYRQGELHRLRGEFSDADEAYRRAEEWGRRPEPGRALLRLAQGRAEAAVTAIRFALDEVQDESSRALLLVAAVDIFLATNGRQDASRAANVLAGIARSVGCPPLIAAAERGQGAVAVAEHAPSAALVHLRSALAGWQSLGAPYEVGRTSELLATAEQLAGDLESAEGHREAARRIYADLGAVTDLRRLGDELPSGLTQREVEVLRLLATGMTNRAIAVHLTISEKTVANHVSNILGKLGLSSRAAATAYAYEHHLV